MKRLLAISLISALALGIVNADGGLVEARVFRASSALASLEPDAAVKGLDEVFGRLVSELVVWTCGLI